MSIDWQLCVTHEKPPHFTSDEVATMMRCLDSLGFLTGLKYECHRGEEYDPDGIEKHDSVDGVINWLATTTGDRFWLKCKISFGVMRDSDKMNSQHPELSQLMDEMMDASEHALIAGGISPVYPPSISALGIAFSMEGTSDSDKLLAYLREQPKFSAMMTALAEALGRPFEACILEHIGYVRVLPEDEVLAAIDDDMQGDWAERMPDAWALVEPRLKSPSMGEIVEESGSTRQQWIVSDVVARKDKEWLIAYDKTPECWVYERPAGQESWKFAYYRHSFFGVLDMIQHEFK